MPAHSGTMAFGSHFAPGGLPVLAVSTHTARRGSQTRPNGHWLSSPQVGRHTLVLRSIDVQRTSSRPWHLFGSSGSLTYVSAGPIVHVSMQTPLCPSALRRQLAAIPPRQSLSTEQLFEQ